MNYKELHCERPYQRATIELDAYELWVFQSMFNKLENDEKYKVDVADDNAKVLREGDNHHTYK